MRALCLLACLAFVACGPESAPGPAPTEAPGAWAGSERERVLGPFLSAHWRLPVPPQGEPPPHFSPAEASLDPDTCRACHPKQWAEWRTSFHAAAWSPGLAGQLIEGGLAAPGEVRSCQSCHTPLSEQIPWDAALRPNPAFDPALRARGVLCPACHVRAHRFFAPPRRPEAAPLTGTHDSAEIRDEYLQSRFCAECHQFFDDAGLNGKPLENTWAEWRASPQAAAGRHCQDCHMPDRAHLWRGIHDPETVRAALDVALVPLGGGETSVSLLLRNRDVGHAFPTYVTPRVFLRIYQSGVDGAELPGTRLEAIIARQVDLAAGVELADTRVLPGESVRLDYALTRQPDAIELVGEVVIDPDHHYRQLYAALLPTLQSPDARRLITRAAELIAASTYTLTEIRLPLR